MSKLKKLISNPLLFFGDAIRNRFLFSSLNESNESLSADSDDLIPTYVIGFSTWKSFMIDWFPERRLFFLPTSLSEKTLYKRYRSKILADKRSEIFIWGFKVDAGVLKFAKDNGVTIKFVEDGFIRSLGLGATKTPPFSLTLDSLTPYFNSQEPSDLENLLNNYDFKANPDLMARAERFIEKLLGSGISKYNNAEKIDISALYGEKTRKRVLVIGQVEDDASIIYGSDRRYTNNDLVLIAALENPNSQVLYKPHPDVLAGHRPMQSNPDDVKHICQVLTQDIPLAQSFETIDHVYTITSQAGFEALIRGIHVTTLGCPFYAGWGLTDERQANSRRKRTLTMLEVFAAAYLLYPKYFDPIYKKSLSAEEALERLIQIKSLPDPMVARMKALEEENRRLRKIIVDELLEKCAP
jgi:capsule polysaccharide export protein KpsC/LpsZ